MATHMHWESYFVEPKNVFDEELVISGEEAHHLSRVMRKKKGDCIWAVDGEGGAYEVEIYNKDKKKIQCKILKRRRCIGEPVANLTLAQGVLKKEKFELLIQKATEIGVSRIIPMLSKKTVVKPGKNKKARWSTIARSAMKQCCRSIIPEITEPLSLNKVLSQGIDCSLRFIAQAQEDSKPLQHYFTDSKNFFHKKALIVVGPEGGFTEEEVNLAQEQGFKKISLGPRRLRAETAGIVLSALVLSELGELG
ncbi:MAG: RsmE family RNA methyltransferase [bacterium]